RGWRRTVGASVKPATGAAEIAADGDDGTGAKIDVELFVIAVGDRTLLVVDGREDHAAGRLHGAGVGYVHHFRHAAGHRKRSAGLHGAAPTPASGRRDVA